MTYTSITSSTQVSSLPDILNGVTTRTVHGYPEVTTGASGFFGTACGVRAFQHGLNDTGLWLFTVPDRVDITVAPTLRLWIAPCGSEASKEVRFDFDWDVANSSTTPVAGTHGTGVTGDDVAVSATVGTVQQHDIALTTAVWGGETTGLIIGELKRRTIADGTELTADIAVIMCGLRYTIER